MTFADLGAYFVWSVASALVGVMVAFALNRWARGGSLVMRVFIAVAASLAPTFCIVGFFFAQLGLISLWFSPDEFLIPFTLQVLLILVCATPMAWFVLRRAPRKPVPMDVFD